MVRGIDLARGREPGSPFVHWSRSTPCPHRHDRLQCKRVAMFSSQRRRGRFRLFFLPVCLRLAPVNTGSRPMHWQYSMSFDSLGLAEPLLRAVREAGYTTPTPIQSQAIPAVLSGGDVMGGAQTGTGKTSGFVLPMLHRLMAQPGVRDEGPQGGPLRGPRGKLPIRCLILTPTRELAAQVEESVRTYGKHSKLTSMVMFGGVGMQPQIDKLRRGVDILVATPGRLLDHHGQRTLDLSHVEIFVLDEADRMLDMGFLPDIKKVLAIVPAKKQSLLFSATFSDEIKALADRLLNAPVLIEVRSEE